MTNAKPKDGFFIGVGCPGCGGSLSLDADFFVTRCEHCDSPLRIIMPDAPPAYLMPCKVPDREIRVQVDRFLKQNDLPLTGHSLQVKKLYYPYWKINASILKLRNKTEVRRICSDSEAQTETVIETPRTSVTVSPYLLTVAAGVEIEGIPATIGMRSETIRVLPLSDENIESEFEILPVTKPWSNVKQTVDSAVASLSEISPADFGRNLTRLFNPSWSLVYFPYLIVETYGPTCRRFLLDGLVGRVIGSVNPETAPAQENELADPIETTAQVAFGELTVVFHRCDVCDADLPTELSHIYICPNCHELQVMGRMDNRLEQIDMAMYGDQPVTCLVPFWRLGLPEVMAQRFGNLLGGLDRCEQMLVPALGTGNFEALHKLAKRMSTAQRKMPTETVESLDERFLPVRIGLPEALALAEIIICHELLDKGLELPDSCLDLEPTSVGLVYIPFHRQDYFYVDSVLSAVSMERTLVE